MLDRLKNRLINEYLYTVIDQYEENNDGHGKSHIKNVVSKTVKIVEHLNKQGENIDLKVATMAAAYHDMGNRYDRKEHHIISANMLRLDENLKMWFSEEEIELMAKACEEHRASYKGEYTSIYSMIISDADRSDNIHTMIKRSYDYNKKHHPELNEEELYNEVYFHLKDKYGENGYARFNLEYTRELLKPARDVIKDEKQFRRIYNEIKES